MSNLSKATTMLTLYYKWSKNLSFTSLISMSLKWRAATSPLSLAVLEDLLPVLLLLVYRPCGWHALRSGEGKVHGNAASLSTLATEACNGRFWRQRCCGRRIITLVRLAGPTFTLHRSVTSSARKSFQFGDKTEKT